MRIGFSPGRRVLAGLCPGSWWLYGSVTVLSRRVFGVTFRILRAKFAFECFIQLPYCRTIVSIIIK
jgi:hypothetical protein